MSRIARPPTRPATRLFTPAAPVSVILVGALAVLTAPSALAQVNKCRQPDGSIVYQQGPCGGAQTDARSSGTSATSRANAAPASSDAGTDAGARAAQLKLKKEVADVEHRQKVRYAIESRQPMVGMTRQELDLAMGPPSKVNASQYGARLKDQLIYERGERTLYVYTENGMVTAIQNWGTIGARDKPPCPTAAQIRDLEIEASKFTNRGDERKQADIAKKLEKARACR